MSVTLSPEGIEVAYRALGAGPPDLVFLHGWAASVAYFEELFDALDASAGDARRVVLLRRNVDAMKELVTPFLTGPVDEVAYDGFAHDAARVPRSALEGTMQVTLETDFAPSLPSIAAPTLVIAGARVTTRS